MLTRKPSAVAPAAYPTGKDGRAAAPPAPARPPGQPSWRGRPLPTEPPAKSALRRGSPRTERPGLGSAYCCTRDPGLRAVQPSDLAGQGPPRAFPRPGLGEAVVPSSAFPSRSGPAAACNVGRPAPAHPAPRGVANSRAQARLNFTAAGAPPVGVRRGALSRASPQFLDARFYCPRFSPRKSGVRCPEGWGGATGSG